MRVENQVVSGGQVQQRLVEGDRLVAQHIERSASNLPGLQGVDQVGLVDHGAARSVDQHGVMLHPGQLLATDQVPGLCGQRAVDRDHIAAAQQLLQRQVALTLVVAIAIEEVDVHLQAASQLRQSLGDRTMADDAEHLAANVADRVVETGTAPRPLASAHVHQQLVITADVAQQRENHRQRMFGHRMGTVAGHVTDMNPAAPAIIEVDHIGAGHGQGDHLQCRQLLQMLHRDRYAAGDGDGRAAQPFNHLLGCGVVVKGPAMGKRQLFDPHAFGEAVTVEEYDVMQHGHLLKASIVVVFFPSAGGARLDFQAVSAVGQCCADAGTRRRVLLIDPGVVDRVHGIEVGHVGEPDLHPGEVGLVDLGHGQNVFQLLQHVAGLGADVLAQITGDDASCFDPVCADHALAVAGVAAQSL
ncbi:hypothetical protein D3C75_704830 [compost metagenome]